MTSNKRIIYLGSDVEFFSELVEQLGSRGYQLEQVENLEGPVEEYLGDWYQLLVLDIDLTTSNGLELLRTIKSNNGGVPLVVIAEPNKLELTHIAVSRQNGAEALFFKPLTDFKPLLSEIETAFHKIERWWKMLEELRKRRKLESANA